MNWKWSVVLILMLLLVIFTAQNYKVVKIQFLLWSFQTSRAIVIFSAFFVGILTGWLTSFIKRK